MYLCSIDHDLPLELPATEGAARVRLRFRRGSFRLPALLTKRWILPSRARATPRTELEYRRRLWERGGFYRFTVEEVGEFSWRSGSGEIRYRLATRNPARLRYGLLHLVLPGYLQLEGIYEVLHAGAVVIGGRAAVFLAPSHGGKSTLVDYCLRRGDPLLADDRLPLIREEGEWRAAPSHPWVRMGRREGDLGIRRVPFMSETVPLGAMFRLDPVEKGEAIRLEALEGRERFRSLHAARLFPFASFPEGDDEVPHRFFRIGSLPLHRLTVPRDLSRLPELYRTLREYLEGMDL